MANQNANNDDFLEMYGEGPVEFTSVQRKQYKAWHKPRKQYVRNMQWCNEISGLINDLDLTNRPFRYLTLPGEDMLDVRYFHEKIFEPQRINLNFTGFLSSIKRLTVDQSARIEIDQHAARLELDYIDKNSKIIKDDIRNVAIRDSLRKWNLIREGPFHAINFDLCGGIAASDNEEQNPNYFDALSTILSVQSKSNEDFVLLITTRIDDQCAPPKATKKIHEVIEDYYLNCEKYASRLENIWGIPCANPCTELIELIGEESVRLLGLTLWIIDMGVANDLKGRILNFMTYRVRGDLKHDDIASFSIRFTPSLHRPKDPYSLCNTEGGNEEIPISRCDQVEPIPDLINQTIYVDEVLAQNRPIYNQCLDETAILLKGAGYDEGGYRSWIAEQGF